jgi:hypothetical protein
MNIGGLPFADVGGRRTTLVPLDQLRAFAGRRRDPANAGGTAEVQAEIEARQAEARRVGCDRLYFDGMVMAGLQAITSGLSLKPGECALADVPARLARYRAGVRYQGRSRRVSVPLGAGIRYRVGRFGGRRISEPQLRVEDTGRLVVTNQRIVFVGQQRAVAVPRSKILQLVPARDGFQ